MAYERVDIETFVHETEKWTTHLFLKKEVLQAYGANIRCFLHRSGSEVTGAFVGFETKILGRKALITPPYMPNIGPMWPPREGKTVTLNTARKKLLTAWVDFLQQSGYSAFELSFPTEVTDVQPVIWADLSVHVRYTYQLGTDLDAGAIFSGYEDKLKSDIRKCEESKCQIRTIRPSADNILLIASGLKIKGALAHETTLVKLVEALAEHGAWLTEATFENQPVAQVLVAPSGKTAYYLLGGTSDLGKSLSAGPFALHNAILSASKQGCKTFDFEGSMIPNVERYFRQFGGKPVPYFMVTQGMKTYRKLRKWMGKI